jgi:hypothetical protein
MEKGGSTFIHQHTRQQAGNEQQDTRRAMMLLSQRFSRLDVALDSGTHDMPRSAMPMRRSR